MCYEPNRIVIRVCWVSSSLQNYLNKSIWYQWNINNLWDILQVFIRPKHRNLEQNNTHGSRNKQRPDSLHVLDSDINTMNAFYWVWLLNANLTNQINVLWGKSNSGDFQVCLWTASFRASFMCNLSHNQANNVCNTGAWGWVFYILNDWYLTLLYIMNLMYSHTCDPT